MVNMWDITILQLAVREQTAMVDPLLSQLRFVPLFSQLHIIGPVNSTNTNQISGLSYKGKTLF